MEKQVKKPDYIGLDELSDLRNHFALSKKVEPFTHPGFTDEHGTEPNKIYFSVVISEMLKTSDDFKMIFDWQFSKYKTKFKFGNISDFIKYEYKKIKGLIEKVLTLKGINENEVYQMAESYLMYIEKLSEQQGIKLTASVANIEEQHNIKPITPELINTIHKKKSETNYPDKFYAWYHGIRIVLGKERAFPNNFGKKEIIEFGANTYGTGEGFYKVFSHLDLTKTYTFLKSMNSHDRANWKKKLIDISNKNADILDYLNKFSN